MLYFSDPFPETLIWSRHCISVAVSALFIALPPSSFFLAVYKAPAAPPAYNGALLPARFQHAVEIQKLQKTYYMISDEKARASYDALQRVRKERVQNESRHSAKRQKLMRDLAEKENAHGREPKGKSQDDDVSWRLKAEIARICNNRGRQFKESASFDQKDPAIG